MAKSELRSVETQAELASGINQEHPWPSSVAQCPDLLTAYDIYSEAQTQRAHHDWPALDLIELARTCKMIALADREFEEMLVEGVLIEGGRSGRTLVENPRGRAVSTLNSAISSSLRRLGITSASVSEKRSQANRANAEREAEKTAATGDDGLLA